MRSSTQATRALAVWACVFGLAALSPPARAAIERPAVRAWRGAGLWQRDGHDSGQRWQIDLTRRTDDAVEGTVTLSGSPLLTNGTLRGTIDGRQVSGRISDAAGNHVADFVGRIAPDGSWRGSYRDRSGEVGRWSWDGGAPR